MERPARIPDGVRAHLERLGEQAVHELIDFLRIPSVSALSEHRDDVRRAAEWVARRMQRAGIEHVEVLPTPLHPVVVGDWLHAPAGRPTVLVYGHFDTQPADPVELWTRPPFEPWVEGDRIYARGASDDKGNMMVPILAAQAWLQGGQGLPVNVRFIFEGQEEVGSPHLAEFVAGRRDRLACDLVVSADGGQFSEERPSLTLGTRGLCAVQIDVKGPARDLHSGTYGGTVQNPIHALVELLASMRAPDGHVLVEGFYDRVEPLSAEQRRYMAMVPHDDGAYRQAIGVRELFGEPGYSTLERQGARPTLEINGIWGGFTGEGVKTVLPSEAHAKLTCRLVKDQDPVEIQRRIEAHVERHAPRGVEVRVRRMEGLARPYAMPVDHWGNRAASDVLQEVYGREPLLLWSGGTVPLYDIFLRELGTYTVTFAFGLPDEPVHAPDEFFRISSLRRGMVAWARLFERLAHAP
ncbi:dipeptidase [Carboxydochorda subterranea]|uniref:Dipeptidase n=1 Tax=Carboxydichorda subterranea TaxID=3109565 RepID=A0ABZ1BYH9_9FIRM|nr:dipeptidase [Limnochorda sp. L945t]WRP17862.1 dipeptidase [Limnochorda sp. L945t]